MGYDDVLEQLRKDIGQEKVLSPKETSDYSSDMAGFEATPAAIVLPENEEDVLKVVNLARSMRIPIVPRGAGSSLTGASVLDNAIVINMGRMNRIIEVDTVNWYVRTQPGVTIEELNRELQKHGFFFPPDPASSYICTVGGAIAEDSGGMRCLKYGTVKEWVLSIRVVLSNGKVVQLGEPLRKNRAGYDLVHLFTGSEGTLGIITEACVRIIPLQKLKRKRYLLNFDTWKDACSTIVELRKNGILPDIFEFMDKDTVSMVNKTFGYNLEESEATILVDVEETETKQAEEIFSKCKVRSISVAQTEEDMERFYSARAMAYLAMKANSSGVWAEDIVVPINMLSDYLEKVKEISSKYRVRIPVGGHAGDGNVHPTIMYDKGDQRSVELAEKVFAELCSLAIEMGGSITGEHGVGIQKAKLLREQLSRHGGEEALRIMKEIKKIVDPEGLMNPQKYVEAA